MLEQVCPEYRQRHYTRAIWQDDAGGDEWNESSAGPNESSAGLVGERREENDLNTKDCPKLIKYLQIPRSKRTDPDPQEEAINDDVWERVNHYGKLHASWTETTSSNVLRSEPTAGDENVASRPTRIHKTSRHNKIWPDSDHCNEKRSRSSRK